MDSWGTLTKSKLRVVNFPSLIIKPLVPEMAEIVLDTGVEQLKSAGITHWISSGTLLGLYRDGGFIPHDTDLDINVLVEKPEAIVVRGFEVCRIMYYQKPQPGSPTGYYSDDYPMQIALTRGGEIFDMYYFYREGDFALNINEYGIIKKPMHFIDNMTTITWHKKEYNAPGPIEDFLTWRFGDWKTPKSSKQSWEQDATHLTLWKDLS
jgi:hypothetical protein